MTVPSRVFVGTTVFGLIASLLIVPYTILVMTGYRPEALSPALSFEAAYNPGFVVFLAVASIMSVGFTVFAWRRLVEGARRDARRRKARVDVAAQQKRYKRQQRPPMGPT